MHIELLAQRVARGRYHTLPSHFTAKQRPTFSRRRRINSRIFRADKKVISRYDDRMKSRLTTLSSVIFEPKMQEVYDNEMIFSEF